MVCLLAGWSKVFTSSSVGLPSCFQIFVQMKFRWHQCLAPLGSPVLGYGWELPAWLTLLRQQSLLTNLYLEIISTPPASSSLLFFWQTTCRCPVRLQNVHKASLNLHAGALCPSLPHR